MAQGPNPRAGNARKRNRIYRARSSRAGVPQSKRARSASHDAALPFSPPEDWHEPREKRTKYRVIRQSPGEGYRHILTAQEVQERLSALPKHFLEPLDTVQFSRMTRKKRSFPCYGLQWGSTLYLYPLEFDLVEYYTRPPTPAQQIEAKMYGAEWQADGSSYWTLTWTELAIRDFYLNNILIHELGHLLDDRNTNAVDRERYAEWFAIEYGYKSGYRTEWLERERELELEALHEL